MASAKVVEIAQERTIDTIIIGKNEGWKMEVDMQKTTKQTFIQIPYATFIGMIRYKANDMEFKSLSERKLYL
ncbi:IS200/IS605 family accessory protein TnpB-related protein [Bacillus sp. ISL-40]|nr:IS200/IS605 family accessory protein TnpB-related protein [Bacillus sp. ISL-40]